MPSLHVTMCLNERLKHHPQLTHSSNSTTLYTCYMQIPLPYQPKSDLFCVRARYVPFNASNIKVRQDSAVIRVAC